MDPVMERKFGNFGNVGKQIRVDERRSVGRVLLLHKLVVAHRLRRAITSPGDVIVLVLAPVLALSYAIVPLNWIGRQQPLALLAGSALVAALAGFAALRTWRARLCALKSGGILSRDLLAPRVSSILLILCGLCVAVAVAVTGCVIGILTASRWCAATMAAACLLGSLLAVATRRPTTASSTGRRLPLSRSPGRGTAMSGMPHIVLARRIGIGGDHRILLAACFAGPLLATMLVVLHGGTQTRSAEDAVVAVSCLAILYLTRIDVDLAAALDLAGTGIVRSTCWCLAPACAVAVAVPLAAAIMGLDTQAAWVPAALMAAMALLFVLRSWRLPRMAPRAADLATLADLAGGVVLSTALLPLGPAFLVLRAALLHRTLRARRRG